MEKEIVKEIKFEVRYKTFTDGSVSIDIDTNLPSSELLGIFLLCQRKIESKYLINFELIEVLAQNSKKKPKK